MRRTSRPLFAVLVTATASRLATLALTFACDYLVTDFDSSSALVDFHECYDDADFGGERGTWVGSLFAASTTDRGEPSGGGALNEVLRRAVVWDGVHFVRICQCGYEFDNQIAFLPLWPLVMRTLQRAVLVPLSALLPSELRVSRAAGCALSGLVLSNLFFVLSAASLYRLARRLGFGTALATQACLLYAFNPASVFYSSIYTESLYNLLHFEALFHLFDDRESASALLASTALLTLATFARSNGILSCSIVFAVRMREALRILLGRVLATKPRGGEGEMVVVARLMGQGLLAAAQCLAVVSPFYFYQVSFQLGWCQKHGEALGNGTDPVEFRVEIDKMRFGWCEGSPLVPKVYRFIQASYWDVGLFKFYKASQVPNFLLAAPIWSCSLFELSEAIRDALPGDSWGAKLGAIKSLVSDRQDYELFVLCLHWVLMLAVSVLIMNVQVSTRFLSTCAPLYLITARLRGKKDKKAHVVWVVRFFALYGILGCLLYPNFLPWV